MPLSKPVKKQQLILPSPYDFYRLSFEKKENILKRLSTDNLVYYLEHIVNAFHDKEQDHRNGECFTLEQILEEDVRGSGGGAGSGSANNAVFINNWLKQNANRNPDLEASFLEQQAGGFAGMTSTKTINQTLLGSQQQSMMKGSGSSADYHRRFNSGGGGSFNMNSMSAALPPPANQQQLYSSGLDGNRGGNGPSKNIWDSVPVNSPSGNSRWQNSSASGSSNAYGASGNSLSLTPFRPAIERPPGLDLRNGTETPVFFHSKVSLGPNRNASINANISGGYQQQYPANSNLSSMSLSATKGKLDPNYTPDYFNMSANSSSAGNRAQSLWDNPSASSSSRFQNSSFGTSVPFKAAIERPSGVPSSFHGGNTSCLLTPISSSTPKKTTTTDKVGSKSSRPAEADQTLSPAVLSQEPLDAEWLSAHKLPTPEAFNELLPEVRTALLADLPRNVKNKYEYHCWSVKLNQLLSQRPALADGDGGRADQKKQSLE